MSYPPPAGGYPDPYQQPPQSGPPAGYGQQPPPGYGPPPGGMPPGGMPPGGPPPGGMPPGGPPPGGMPPGGGYPPPGQPGQPGGFLPPQQPKKSNTGLIVGLSLGGVGLVAIVVVVLLVMFSGGGASSPTAAVEDYLSASENGNPDAAKDLLCEADLSAASGTQELDPEQLAEEAEDVEVSYDVGNEQIDGDKATVDVDMTVTYMGEANENTMTITTVDEDGWKVCISESDLGF